MSPSKIVFKDYIIWHMQFTSFYVMHGLYVASSPLSFENYFNRLSMNACLHLKCLLEGLSEGVFGCIFCLMHDSGIHEQGGMVYD